MHRTRSFVLTFAFAAAFATAFATAQAQIVHSAFDNSLYDDNTSMGGPNVLLAIKTQAPTQFVPTRIEMFTGEASGTNTVELWSHDVATNAPGVLLAGGSWSMSRINSWQGAMLTTTTSISAGQEIWLVWGPIGGAQASSQGTGAGGQLYRGSFNGGASWNGPFQSVQWKFRIWTGSAGHYTAFGAGCLGVIGTPEFDYVGVPYVNSTWTLALDFGAVNSVAILSFGDSDAVFGATPLPFALDMLGAPGCDILAAPLVTLFVATDSFGRAQVTGAIPNDPGFVGFQIFNQWVCLDPPVNSLGVTVSNGGRGIVGL